MAVAENDLPLWNCSSIGGIILYTFERVSFVEAMVSLFVWGVYEDQSWGPIGLLSSGILMEWSVVVSAAHYQVKALRLSRSGTASGSELSTSP